MSDQGGWERTFAEAPHDEGGRKVLGDPNSGCKHCGSVSRKVSANDAVVLYHPSVECCEAALREQVSFRRADLERLRSDWREKQERVADKVRELENTSAPHERRELEVELRRMEAGLGVRTRDYYQPQAAVYEGELRHANAMLARFLEPPSLGLRD